MNPKEPLRDWSYLSRQEGLPTPLDEINVQFLDVSKLRSYARRFITFALAWAQNNSSPPVLEGQVFLYVDSPNRFNIPAIFELYVWAWRNNPQGDFVDWNDHVTCPHQ